MNKSIVFAGGGALGGLVAALVMAGAAQGNTSDPVRIATLESRIVVLERMVADNTRQLAMTKGDGDIRLQGDQNMVVTIARDATVSSGKHIFLTAGDEITLTTGKARLQMKKSGEIILSGGDITIDGSGKVAVKSASDVTVKGRKIAYN